MRPDDDPTGWRKLLKLAEERQRLLYPNRHLEQMMRLAEESARPTRELLRMLEEKEAVRPKWTAIDALQQINSVLRPTRLADVLGETENALRPQRRDLLASIEAASRPSHHLELAFRQAEEALRPTHQIQRLLADQTKFFSWGAALQQSQERIRDLIGQQEHQLKTLAASLRREQMPTLLDALEELIANNPVPSDEADLGGQFEEDVAPPTSEEVDAVIARYQTDVAESRTLTEYLERFATFLESLSNPLKAFVLLVLLPYIVSVCANLTTPVLQERWNQLVHTAPKEALTGVRDAVTSQIDPEHLKEFRFVSIKRLKVHLRAVGQEEVIAVLPLGKAVKIIGVERTRSCIEFIDEATNEVKRGWAATRYLSDFSK